MRILAVDLGTRRIGLAICNPEETLVVGAGVIERKKGDDPLPAIVAALREREAEAIVVGLPLNMDGSISNKSNEATEFAERLRRDVSVPVEVWDERLSSAAAEERLREVQMPRGQKRVRVNQVAAQVILESYLEARQDRPRASS